MPRILVLTDFRETALNAAAYALEIFGPKQNSFILVHAYFMEPLASDLPLAGMSEAVLRSAEEDMEAFKLRFRALPNAAAVELSTVVQYGPLVSVVNDLCEEEHVDVVVMGSNGEASQAGLGSNAGGVAKTCRTAVMVIPAKTRFTGLRRILFADDHVSVEPHAMQLLVQLARQHGADVTVAHVARKMDEEPDPRIIEQYNAVLLGLDHTFVGALGDDVAVELSGIAERNSIDLVVVLHHHMSLLETIFHRSVAKRLAMHSDIPLLVLEH
ncbi:MAG: universal stress protein [Flavobacteriales bacterium]